MSFYHTYRPKQFTDLVGQDHIRTVLQSAILNDKLVHAYLFAGTRGTGKTTTARLLAKTINCPERIINKEAGTVEACGRCELCLSIANGSCLDVVEIDAASNRGIDEIRQLQEQVRFKPQSGIKKIFIIDEVHMLTKEAFNALLKTLEEPPSHLIFILATTEPHKMLATILSRCQRFNFSTPSVEVVSTYLTRMAEAEKLKAEPEAIKMIAELAHGSFRDSATILEQLATDTPSITAAAVIDRLGLPEADLLDRYLAALGGTQDPSLRADLQVYFSQGGNAHNFIDIAFDRLSQLVKQDQAVGSPAQLVGALSRIKYQMKYSPVGELPIMASLAPLGTSIAMPILSASQPAPQSVLKPVKIDKVSDPIEKPKSTIVPTASAPAQTPVVEEQVMAPPVVSTAEVAASPDTVTISVAEQVPPVALPSGEVTDRWEKTLNNLITDSQSSMVAMLRTAKPLSWEAPVLKIGVQFKFHADQLTRQKNRAILEAALTTCFGTPVHVEIDMQPVDDLATAAEEIFA